MATIINRSIIDIDLISSNLTSLYSDYDYDPSSSAIDKIISRWFNSKNKHLIPMFSQHRLFNKKTQIIIPSEVHLSINNDAIDDFINWLQSCENYINGEDWNLSNTFAKTNESCFELLYNTLYKVKDSLITEDVATSLNDVLKGLRFKKLPKGVSENLVVKEEGEDAFTIKFHEIRPGGKVSKSYQKILGYIGFQNVKEDGTLLVPEFNRAYAKFSDAVNPSTIRHKFILSLNPVDFATQSFGNTWASCYTIDTENVRNAETSNHYEGMYNGGTLSDTLDETTFITYMIKNSYDGDEPELQDKIYRCKFAYQRGYLIQSRVYPQSEDDSSGLYKEIRAMTQEIIAESLDLPNLWSAPVKAYDYESKIFRQYGVGYHDLTCASFRNNNITYLKEEISPRYEDYNFERIEIGQGNIICPTCGMVHSDSHIDCDSCHRIRSNETIYCCSCGGEFDEDDLYLIDGDWYCYDCCTECEDCGCYVPNNDILSIEGGNRQICESCYRNGNYMTCENCNEIFHSDNGVYIEDYRGNCYDFCCESCRDANFTRVNNEWYPNDDVEYCKCCHQHVLTENFAFKRNVCKECAKKKCTCGKRLILGEGLLIKDKWYCCEQCAENDGWIKTYNGIYMKKEASFKCSKCGKIDDLRCQVGTMCLECYFWEEEIFCRCGKKIRRKDSIHDKEGNNCFCSMKCAKKEGFVFSEEGLEPIGNLNYCPFCDSYHKDDYFDFIHGICKSCWEKDMCSQCNIEDKDVELFFPVVVSQFHVSYCKPECAIKHGFVETINGEWRLEKECLEITDTGEYIYIG